MGKKKPLHPNTVIMKPQNRQTIRSMRNPEKHRVSHVAVKGMDETKERERERERKRKRARERER